jgi:hypothetical protein
MSQFKREIDTRHNVVLLPQQLLIVCADVLLVVVASASSILSSSCVSPQLSTLPSSAVCSCTDPDVESL